MNRIQSRLILISVILLLATGCTSDSSSPQPTISADPTVAPTPGAGALTVNELMDQIDLAWSGVDSMETTFWATSSVDVGTPPANGNYTVERSIPPNTRQVIQVTDGIVTDEQISIDGRVYMKGSLVVGAIAPMVGPETWVEVDPAAATSDSPAAMQVAYLLQPVESPFASVSAETRALEAFPGDSFTVGDRTCTTYAFGDQAIRYELALDENLLPCRLLQFSGNYVNLTTYAFDDPALVVAAPPIATPEPGS